MKKILLIIPLLLLASCAVTDEQRSEKNKECKKLWLYYDHRYQACIASPYDI